MEKDQSFASFLKGEISWENYLRNSRECKHAIREINAELDFEKCKDCGEII